MAQHPGSDSPFTRNIKNLLNKMMDKTPVRDSMFEGAIDFFATHDENEEKLKFAELQVIEAEQELSMNDDSNRETKLQDKLSKLKSLRNDLAKQIDDERLVRFERVEKLAHNIMQEIHGSTMEDMNKNVSRFLGILQLLSPTEGKGVAKANQKTKHLYKAVLCVRLLHHLLENNEINDDYVVKLYHEHQQFLKSKKDPSEIEVSPFRVGVEIPVIIAAMSQDIGQYHQAAQKILKGEEGNLDEFRMLEKEERNELLKITYSQSLKYVTHGLGMDKYRGNSKEDRDKFMEQQKQRLHFMRELLKSAVNPGQTIGNLLKVPQVYCSVVMSTKPNYSYETLPRVVAVMEKGAEVGAYCANVSDALMSMVGWFPQGFGVTYIPKDSDGKDADRYEFAIVNTLYPQAPDVPVCRVATRGLTYSTFSINHAIGKHNNLYYANTRKKIERMSKQRLQEILMQLSSNFKERQEMDLIPKCWHPQDFFSESKRQNLWNKAETYRI